MTIENGQSPEQEKLEILEKLKALIGKSTYLNEGEKTIASIVVERLHNGKIVLRIHNYRMMPIVLTHVWTFNQETGDETFFAGEFMGEGGEVAARTPTFSPLS